jgi:uncharacterized protein YfaS (alpha-2-macroglobulin family)
VRALQEESPESMRGEAAGGTRAQVEGVPVGNRAPADSTLLVELRDDRTALFASAIPAGRYVYRQALHLTTPGLYHVLPAHAAQLYKPEVFGHTAEAGFAVW